MVKRGHNSLVIGGWEKVEQEKTKHVFVRNHNKGKEKTDFQKVSRKRVEGKKKIPP